jgi:hypothetical protein
VQIDLDFTTFRSFCPPSGKAYQIFYVLTGGLVNQVYCVYYPGIRFTFTPGVLIADFKGLYNESLEANSMADVEITNPNIVTEPTPNATAFTIQNTTVTTAGTPVQLPSIVVPDGRALVVASDGGNNVKNVVYVATSSVNAGDPTKRVTLAPGNSVKLYVTNANLVWVDSSANGQKVNVIVEQ